MKPDDNVKDFLQQYRPELPPPSSQQEQRLMAKLATTDQSGSIPWGRVVTIGATMVGVGLAIGGLLNPPQRFARNAIDTVALEAFLMDTWAGSVHRETIAQEQPVNDRWLSLINP